MWLQTLEFPVAGGWAKLYIVWAEQAEIQTSMEKYWTCPGRMPKEKYLENNVGAAASRRVIRAGGRTEPVGGLGPARERWGRRCSRWMLLSFSTSGSLLGDEILFLHSQKELNICPRKSLCEVETSTKNTP